MKDQPVSGGTPTSVIVTIGLQELLAKAGLAETSDGSLLTSDQLLRIADEAEIWPTIVNQNNVPLALGRTDDSPPQVKRWRLHIRDSGCSFPAALIRPAGATGTTFGLGSSVDLLILTSTLFVSCT